MKKKLIKTIIVSTLVLSLVPNDIYANDFKNNENKYLQLCASTSLSQSQIDTCRDFNSYLAQKNEDVKDQIGQTENLLDDTKNNLKKLKSEVATLDQEIANQENELKYLQTSIDNLNSQIKINEEEISKRMYAMQAYSNSNVLVSFIFGSSSITDFISRNAVLNNLTAYDEKLLSDLLADKELVDIQKKQADETMAVLEEKKSVQVAMQAEYDRLFAQQLEILENQESTSDELTENQQHIEASIAASFDKLNQSGSSSGGLVSPGLSATGNAVANKALTRLGSRYWWGAPGGGYGDGQGLDNPNAIYFDCSGLVAWAHRQAGVSIPRTTSSGYSRMGQSVSRSQLQAGDVVTFNGGSGAVFHIGIYIGDGKVVHASGYGSGTTGQKPNECVKVHSLSYLDSILGVYNYRRLY